MKAYIGIKYHEDFRNKELVNELSSILGKKGYESFCIVRDISKEELDLCQYSRHIFSNNFTQPS